MKNFAYLYCLSYRRAGFEPICYKIGITNDYLTRRLSNQANLAGYERTVAYDVWQLKDPTLACEIEVSKTIEYMSVYGFDHVRGAQFDTPTQSVPTNGRRSTRQWSKLSSAFKLCAAYHGTCYACHGDHLSSKCPNTDLDSKYSREYFAKTGVCRHISTRSWGRNLKHIKKMKRIFRRLHCTLEDDGRPSSFTENCRYNLRKRDKK